MRHLRKLTFLTLLCFGWCVSSTGVARADTVNFDDLPANTVVTNQYPGVSFTSEAGFQIKTYPFAELFNTSEPNFIGPANADGFDFARELIVDFTTGVNDLSFAVAGSDGTGTVGLIDIFQGGTFSTTLNFIGNGAPFTPQTVNLSAFGNITRIRFHDITDGAGLGYDDFSFTPQGTAPVPEPATMILLGTGLAGLGGVMKRKRQGKNM